MKNWLILLPALAASALISAAMRAAVPAGPVVIDGQRLSCMLPPTDSSASFERGKLLYKTYCLSCHQFDGGGVENLNPPIIKTPFVLGDKTRLIKIILHGFNEKVDIEGDTYSNNMPPLNNLTDQQIADVLTYVRNDFGNKATRIKTTEVRQIRAGSGRK